MKPPPEPAPAASADAAAMRLDKWLWAARFYKTRALATQAAQHGRVQVNGHSAKPARELRVGDRIELRQGALLRSIEVCALDARRGPAPQAQALYRETAESIERARQAAQHRRAEAEPAQAHGRPTKRDRRALAQWQRWSASIDDG